ncbi:30S ribosomal protein S17 [Betaproteobacteria bacterium]|nr:30S ribosomal protein S17 [Betaproteobacteria bacterium]
MSIKEKKFVTGRVIQNTQDKTISVLVERKVKHPVLGKFISKSKKYQVHNESGSFNIGDMVKIRECRPISKRKSWIVVD